MYDCWDEVEGRPVSVSLSILCDETSSSDLRDEPGPSDRPVKLFKTHISQSRSYTYRPAPGELSQTQCEQLASALKRITFTLEELDLSRNSVKESGAELLFAALESSNCKVTTLRLSDCILSKRCLDSLVSVLNADHLMELDLSGNKYLRDSGVKLLSDGLRNRYGRLRTLRLSSCNLSENSCDYLASAIKSRPDCFEELDLSLNNLQDSGIKLLSDGLKSQYCKLKTLRLVNCLISDEGCAALVSALQSKHSDLTELDLSGNELQDQGMKLLSALVESPDCKLKTLRVEEGRNLITMGKTKRSDSAQRYSAPDDLWKTTRSQQPPLPPKAAPLPREQLYTRQGKKPLGELEQHKQRRQTAPLTTPDELLKEEQQLEENRTEQTSLESLTAASPDDAHLPLDLSTTNTESGSSEENKEVMEQPPTVHDPSHFTPEISINTFGETSYRFRVEYPGTYQCTSTRLVFTMCREGELLYRIVQWDESLLQSAGKMPAGPLFDIQCSEDSVFQLHIPHCETKPASLSDGLSVAHISDDGMRILDPLKITDTHVVVDVPHLSAFGLVWDIMKMFLNIDKPIRGQILLFHRLRENRKLNVFLLPENIPLQEVRQQQEGAEYIEAPSSCHLIKGHTYSLHSPENYRVQPLRAQFDFNYGPNYHPTFEIRPNSNAEEVTVMVRDQEERHVWEYNARFNALASSSSSTQPPAGGGGPGPSRQTLSRTESLQGEEEEKLLSVRTEFIKRVSGSVLKDLLDKLLEKKVLNSRELESIQTMSRTDKARELIDLVLKKGNSACKTLIENVCDLDPFVSETLQLK